jgi:hypothetical protein
MKEAHAEQALGFLDLLGERGRGDAEFLRRAREMQMPGHADETADVAKFDGAHGISKFVNYLAILWQ